MSKNDDKQRKVHKHKHSDPKKHRDRHHHHNKDKKRTMNPGPSARASSSTDTGSSSSASHPYIEQGPHASISVKALPGSSFLYARDASYAIREDAYVKEVLDSSGHPTVLMNCQISHGILVRPNIRHAKFEYPDGSFMHCVPVCDVKVLSMHAVYRMGRGREYINSASEVYGRDSVLLQMRTTIVNKLKKHASKVYNKQYEKDNILSFGQPDDQNPSVTLVPSTVRSHAQLIAKVRGAVVEKRVSKVAGWDNKNIYGDVLIALKYVRNVAKNSAELVFELQDVMVRRGADKLFGTSSSSS